MRLRQSISSLRQMVLVNRHVTIVCAIGSFHVSVTGEHLFLLFTAISAVKSLFQIQNFHFYFQMPRALISSQRGNHRLRQQLNGSIPSVLSVQALPCAIPTPWIPSWIHLGTTYVTHHRPMQLNHLTAQRLIPGCRLINMLAV